MTQLPVRPTDTQPSDGERPETASLLLPETVSPVVGEWPGSGSKKNLSTSFSVWLAETLPHYLRSLLCLGRGRLFRASVRHGLVANGETRCVCVFLVSERHVLFVIGFFKATEKHMVLRPAGPACSLSPPFIFYRLLGRNAQWSVLVTG